MQYTCEVSWIPVKDELVSVGIRLIDGTMRFQMMDEMEHKNFVSAVPNFCFTLPKIISDERAVERVTEELKQRIKQKSSDFVNKSHKLYEREMNMLNKLIIDDDKDDADHQRAKDQIFERLYPQVDLEWIQFRLLLCIRANVERINFLIGNMTLFSICC